MERLFLVFKLLYTSIRQWKYKILNVAWEHDHKVDYFSQVLKYITYDTMYLCKNWKARDLGQFINVKYVFITFVILYTSRQNKHGCGS